MCVAGLRIVGCHDINTRDSGYQDTLSCVTAWRLTANCEVCNFSLLATEALQERFHENTKFILAWGYLSDPQPTRRILIDYNISILG